MAESTFAPKRELGSVVSVVQTGHIIVKLRDKGLAGRLRRIGLKVYRTMSFRAPEEAYVGRLSDIIGNVESPYAVVRAKDKNVLVEIREGDPLYVELPVKPRKRIQRLRGRPRPEMPSKPRKSRGMRGIGGRRRKRGGERERSRAPGRGG